MRSGIGQAQRATAAGERIFSLDGITAYRRSGEVVSLEALEEQLAQFKRNFAKVDMSYARRKNLTAYDVLTIASLIARATGSWSGGATAAALLSGALVGEAFAAAYAVAVVITLRMLASR